MLELTDAQKREQAIQRSIEVTFSVPANERAGVLTLALSRVLRAANRGKPLSDEKAVPVAQKLLEQLTGWPAESWVVAYKEGK